MQNAWQKFLKTGEVKYYIQYKNELNASKIGSNDERSKRNNTK